MKRPVVNVLYTPGTNSHQETMVAFERAGATAHLLFLSDVLQGKARLDDGDALCIPGGFSYGDHLGAGALAGAYLREKLATQLASAVTKPVIAICNGFQIAVRGGVFGPDVALDVNKGQTFKHVMHQPHKVVAGTNCVWLSGLEDQELRFPCAHGEGCFSYKTKNGWQPALSYPAGTNPDGSQDDIAGIASENGLVFGLMDHPERLLSNEANQQIFNNGVAAAR